MQRSNGSTTTMQSEDREFGGEFLEKIVDHLVGKYSVQELFGLDYIRTNFEPADVFDGAQLEEWAEENGYVKAE